MVNKKFFIVLYTLCLIFSSICFAQMSNYCSTPPFVVSAVPPNVLFVIDLSGSMLWSAYNPRSNGTSWCTYKDGDKTNPSPGERNGCGNIYTGTEEGYFTPNKVYRYNNSGGYWEETDGPPDVSGCVDSYREIKYNKKYLGACLNFIYMSRMDLVRWAITGGKPDSCEQSPCEYNPDYTTSRNQPSYCDFELYGQSGNRLSCDDEGCILKCGALCSETSKKKAKVKVPWERIYQSLIFQFRNMTLKPRLGVLLYSGDGIRSNKVYIGDFKNSGSIDSQNPYKHLATTINYETPYGSTPTAPALWDAYNYFSQNNPEYGGFTPQKSSSDKWRNPMYQCIDENNDGVCQESEFSLVPCAKNFVILLTDGQWKKGGKPVRTICTIDYGFERHSADPVVPAYWLHKKGFTNSKTGIFSYVDTVYAIGLWLGGTGEQSLKNVAMYGSFDRDHGNWPASLNGYPMQRCGPIDDCCSGSNCGRGSACTPLPSSSSDWDKDGDNEPDSFLSASNASEIAEKLRSVFRSILKQVSSGTAASILSKQAEAGTALLQAVFYPQKRFGEGVNAKDVNWTGCLYDWWLYTGRVSGELVNNIREDTIENKNLDICEPDGTSGGDYIMEYIFENGQLKIDAYKSDISGQKADTSPETTYSSLDETHPVWEAGENLCEESSPLNNRTIYVVAGNLEPASAVRMSELKNLSNSYSKLFGDDDGDGTIDESGETYSPGSEMTFSNLKNYIYGIDTSGLRSRQINTGNIWKLSDIIYSTPKTVDYDDYSVVYVGGNDGMLHAFKLGKMRYDNLGPYQQVKLRNSATDNDTDELGKELWAFIPKNILPYLRFLANPDYCHLYYVDLSPYIIELDTDNDGSIDKRILIGGMRLGGGVGCSETDCVNPPQDTCPTPSNYDPSRDPSTTPSGCLGLSSYFALDITDPESPLFLWEFTNPDLGFTYTGPAFIKRKDTDGNPHYYLMFLSGPTNYDGESEQDLRVFVLSMNDDFTISSKTVIDGNNSYSISGFSHKKDPDLSSFNNSFGGRLFTEGIDYDDDGNTDMVFFGVTKKSGNTFQGNIIAVKTDDLDPLNWDFKKVFNSAIKPVTAKVEYMKCFNMNYIFFGTGRYFYKEDDPGQNQNDREVLYGVRIDDCLEEGNCNINAAHSSSDACTQLRNGNKLFSWYQELNPKEDEYYKERNISDPSVTDFNTILFSTTEPTSDLCGYGGRSRIWGLNCATGEGLDNQNCPPYVVQELKGTTYLQTSVGKITPYPISIGGSGPQSNPFEQKEGKATSWTQGVTPESPTPFYSPNPGSSSGQGEILYWIEH